MHDRLPIPYAIKSQFSRKHCRNCGQHFPLKICQYHHIIPYAVYPCHDDITCVCPECHVKLQLKKPIYHKDARGHECTVCKCKEYDVKWELEGYWLCGWCVNKIMQNQKEYLSIIGEKKIKELKAIYHSLKT